MFCVCGLTKDELDVLKAALGEATIKVKDLKFFLALQEKLNNVQEHSCSRCEVKDGVDS